MRKSFVPLRQFVYDRLYHPKEGYFCRKDFQVGQLKKPINFKTLIGYDDYQKQLSENYPKNAWLTPCQIFKPYYGMAIANYIKIANEMYKTKKNIYSKVRIVQAGAGTGSAAQSIIYFFKNFQPQIYQNFEYTIVEISPSLCQRTQQKLTKAYPLLVKNGQIKIINDDIKNYRSQQLVYLMFFEVLDNMPHDKIIFNENTKSFQTFSAINLSTKQQIFQLIQKDLIIKQCLKIYLQSIKKTPPKTAAPLFDRIAQKIVQIIYKKKTEGSQDVFLPTFLYTLLKQISKNIPNSHLIISDFDNLISSISGVCAPIVSKKGQKSSQKQDFNTYLVDRGSADIFFPVNFNLLKMMCQQLTKKSGTVVKTHEFIQQFSQSNWARTKSFYNPVKQDFGNTSFFVTDIGGPGPNTSKK